MSPIRPGRLGRGFWPGILRDREWLLMLPGNAERWNAVAGLEHVIGRFGRSLEAAVQTG